jgi:Zn-dependent protease
LPEAHDCPKIALARTPKQEVVGSESFTPRASSYEYSISFGPPRSNKRRVYTSPKELKHLIPAALLIIGIGFSIVFYTNYFNYNYFGNLGWGWTEMSLFAVLLTVSFLIHEMAHKIIAQRGGLWAEFRLTKWGALLTLISIFTPFRAIAPGAMMISGPARLHEVGKISIAGPVTNITLSLVFLGAANLPVSLSYYVLFLWIAYFNAFLAAFNLIPFGILDGFTIFNWNKKVWAPAFVVAAALAIYTYLLI